MQEKSYQERRIDGIISACEEMQNSVSEMDYRLSFFRLMEKVVVVTEEVECYIKRSKTELLTDIDRGFSYEEKANQLEGLTKVILQPRQLHLNLLQRNTDLLEYDDAVNEKYIKESTKRYIPYDADKYLEELNEEDYMEVYKKAGKRKLFTSNQVSVFFRNAIGELIKKMRELDDILFKGNKTLYPSLYDTQFGEATLKYAIGAERPKFDHWRENHDATEEDAKWKNKIVDHIYVCMAELFDSEFLYYYENTLTEDDKDKLRQQCSCIKAIGDKNAELYLNLCDLVDMNISQKDIKYKPSSKKIGRYLYQKRDNIDREGIVAFRKFLAELYLHHEALKGMAKTKKLDYDVVTFQFKKLLKESKWLWDFVAEGYNENYFDQFVDELMKSEHKDDIAKGWEKPKSREKMKAHLLGALLKAGILTGTAAEIARKYIGKKCQEANNFADYISEGKKNSKCNYSDWVNDYVNG